MERLSRKLRSERGASLLLALLMFLVCAMAEKNPARRWIEVVNTGS